jgi:hypothetical protein
MKLTFLGTRGYIKPRSVRHRMHTSTMIAYRGKKVMIECGETWLVANQRAREGGAVADIKPSCILCPLCLTYRRSVRFRRMRKKEPSVRIAKNLLP